MSKISKLPGKTEVWFECVQCGTKFHSTARDVRAQEKRRKNKHHRYCSKTCRNKNLNVNRINNFLVKCSWCGFELKKVPGDKRKSKSGNLFCSRRCAATYNNTHKKHGTRRSKLEQWLEEKIRSDYPNLEVIFNGKEAINSELDIYFPTLKLAVELNGIFHYEPIFGAEKLASIQNNDDRKFQACLERGIELIIIDTSSFTYFKEVRAQKYHQIIKNLVDLKSGKSSTNII